MIAKVQQPSGPSSSSAQPTSYVVVDDKQPGTSRQMIFNPPSAAQHFWIIQSLRSYSQCAHISTDGHITAIFTLSTSTSTVTSAIFHSSGTVKTSQPVQSAESAQISRLACTSSTKPGPFKDHLNCPKTIIKLHVCTQIQKKHNVKHLHLPTVQQKLCE